MAICDSLKCANVSFLPSQGDTDPDDFQYELSAPLPVGPVRASGSKDAEVEVEMEVKVEVEEEEEPPLPPPRFPPPPPPLPPPRNVSWQGKKKYRQFAHPCRLGMSTNRLIHNPVANLASGTF